MPCILSRPTQITDSVSGTITRTVESDGMVSFEGRQDSTPFAHVGERVEVRSTEVLRVAKKERRS